MTNTHRLAAFENWLLSSPRSDGTIALRLRHIRALAARYDLDSLTETELEAERADMRRLAAETRKSVLSSWRLYFTWATKKGHRPDDPSRDLEPVRIPPPAPRVASDDRLRSALTDAPPRERAMILLARAAWLRLSEIAGLSTLHRDGDRLRVVGKGNKTRIVIIDAQTAHALDELERTQGPGYYFPGRFGGHMRPDSVNKVITRTTGYNPHALRHAGSTSGFRGTKDLRATQDRLGHASIATTQRYVHLDDDDRRAIAYASSLNA